MSLSTTNFWDEKTILVTGGAGFLGSHVVDGLSERASSERIVIPRREQYDLRKKKDIVRLFQDIEPDIIIHAAATVGGIGAINREPGRHFYDNAIMGIELLEQARRCGVEKCTVIGTACSYPKSSAVPTAENELFAGYPDETNAPYGIAKRSLIAQSQAYRKEYDFNSIHLIPVNLYGPRDNFELAGAHVIPALIRKSIEAREANQESITVWGTGTATREFLFVRDAARAILDATERYNKSDPVNIGSGDELSIQALVEIIVKETDFTGTIQWDTSMPEGQKRRLLDSSKAQREFGWSATTPFQDGIRETVTWFERNNGITAKN